MKNLLKKIIVLILTLEARLVLFKYAPRIVGVTGSVGKTSTKDAVATALAATHFVRKSEKSYNSELGVPLTILGCTSGWGSVQQWLNVIVEGVLLILFKNHYPRWLVLEIGADKPGDIGAIVRWLPLDVAIINPVGPTPVHVEFFPSRDALLAEKIRITEGLRRDGVLVLNYDDPDIRALKEKSRWKTYTVGFDAGADFIASHDAVLYAENGRPVGLTFKVTSGGSVLPIELRAVLGRQHVYPVLAALAVGVSHDINLIAMADVFREHVPAPGRMRILEGVNGATLIDDSYNSSPIAVEEALHTLMALQTKGKKIAVLGDMMELGKFSPESHRAAGAQAAESANTLITVGVRARGIAEGATEAGMAKENVHSFDSAPEAGEYLKGIVHEGDTVLLKGSQSVRMERAVAMLLAHPEQSKDLLVRQEEEWLKR